MDSLESAADRLVLCLERAEADLKAVSHRLEVEIHQRYSGKGVRREPQDVPTLWGCCRGLLC